MVLGIDVSAYQRSISWKAVKEAGVEYGFVKATEGTGYVNPTYERHRNAARRHGIPVGAYHFARPDSDDGPLAEADFFLEVAAPGQGDLLPVLDFELAGMGPAKLRRWAKDWLKRVEKRIGQPPILYTYSAFWTSTVDNAVGLSRYPLWLNRLMRGTTLDQLRIGGEPAPAAGYGPPWRLMAKGEVQHEARRLDAAFLERVAEQARTGGGAVIRGTPREPS